MKKETFLMGLVCLSVGCGSSSKSYREVVDSSGSKPEWVSSSKRAWENDGKLGRVASYTVSGSDRVSSCMTMAKLDAKSNLVSEISEDFKGTLDSAGQGLSENAEVVLAEARSSKYAVR